MVIDQLALFQEEKPKKKIRRDLLIRTVSFDQQEIVKWIMQLYLNGKPFDCDPTYSIGVIWRGLQQPRLKYDIKPQAPGVEPASADQLPLTDGALKSIFYDPPFLIATGKGSVMKARFSDFPNVNALWSFYRNSLIEFYRVLDGKGILAIKCQDLISGGKQVASQFEIMKAAFELGFDWLDTFILINDRPIVPPQTQKHARKTHSYFLVFQKATRKITKSEG